MSILSDATLPGDLLRARDCLTAAGEVWPVPGGLSDKYDGVVGIYAGGVEYPGAALMSVGAAVKSTSPMVRYVGPTDSQLIALAHPEVVSSPTPQQAGRVQAWVVGPGLAVDGEDGDKNAEQLDWFLRRPETLLLDASALRIVAADSELMKILRGRVQAGRSTVLTPHAGEFAALARALGSEEAAEWAGTDQEFDLRRRACAWLAQQLHCVVLLKGRYTIVSDGETSWGIDAEHSWSATPGSGDVLAGITGAVIAAGSEHPLLHCVLGSVAVHAVAALRAAETPEGVAPISATQITQHVQPVVALALVRADR